MTSTDGTATQPDDYQQLSANYTFVPSDFRRVPAGSEHRYQASRPVSVLVYDDTDDEPDERFTVTLAYADPDPPHLQGGNSTATVTITDDDPVPLVLSWERPEWSVEESDGSVTLKAVATTTINRIPEEGFSFEATVDTRQSGRASRASDYTHLSVTETFLRSDFSSVTFDGQSRYQAEKEFTITIEADSIDESNEDFSVELGFAGSMHPNLTTGITDATVWIIEDDDSTADVQLTRNSSPGQRIPGRHADLHVHRQEQRASRGHRRHPDKRVGRQCSRQYARPSFGMPPFRRISGRRSEL